MSVSLQWEGATFQTRCQKVHTFTHEAVFVTPAACHNLRQSHAPVHRRTTQTDTGSGLQAGPTCSHISLAHLLYGT